MSKLLPTPKNVLTSNTSELSRRMEEIIEKLHTYNGKGEIYFDFPLTWDVQKELKRSGWSVKSYTDQGFWVKPRGFPLRFRYSEVSLVFGVAALVFIIGSAFCIETRSVFSVLSSVLVVILTFVRCLEDG